MKGWWLVVAVFSEIPSEYRLSHGALSKAKERLERAEIEVKRINTTVTEDMLEAAKCDVENTVAKLKITNAECRRARFKYFVCHLLSVPGLLTLAIVAICIALLLLVVALAFGLRFGILIVF